MPPETSIRWALTQWLSSESSEAIIGPNVIRHTGAAKRSAACNKLVDFWIIAHDAATKVRRNRARSNSVDRDTARAEVICKVARQHLERTLE